MQFQFRSSRPARVSFLCLPPECAAAWLPASRWSAAALGSGILVTNINGNRELLVRHRPRPFDHEWPRTDHELRQLDLWQIAVVEDLVEASVNFIENQLSALGLSEQQVSMAAERIHAVVLSAWVSGALTDLSGPDPGLVAAFLSRRFGVVRPPVKLVSVLADSPQ